MLKVCKTPGPNVHDEVRCDYGTFLSHDVASVYSAVFESVSKKK